MYRVSLVDDRRLRRGALGSFLRASGKVALADEVATFGELVAPTDVVLVDYACDGTAGDRAARLILLDVPPQAGAAGFDAAAGWLALDADPATLFDAIEAVGGGGRYVSSSLASPAPLAGGVSRRELEVMRALAAGHTNHEIAAELGISVKTVDTHRGHVLKKLELRNNSDLTRFAIARGYLRP